MVITFLFPTMTNTILLAALDRCVLLLLLTQKYETASLYICLDYLLLLLLQCYCYIYCDFFSFFSDLLKKNLIKVLLQQLVILLLHLLLLLLAYLSFSSLLKENLIKLYNARLTFISKLLMITSWKSGDCSLFSKYVTTTTTPRFPWRIIIC